MSIGPKWMPFAWRELGVRETPGPESTSRILLYDTMTTLKATSDEVPWCSAAHCWVYEQAAIRSTRSAAAVSWLSWGLPLKRLVYGATIILYRGDDLSLGHVTFLVDFDFESFWGLGGNQGDSFSVARFDQAQIRDIRWPNGIELPS